MSAGLLHARITVCALMVSILTVVNVQEDILERTVGQVSVRGKGREGKGREEFKTHSI